MEPETNNLAARPSVQEPGRRYTPRQHRPRAGVDIGYARRGSSPQKIPHLPQLTQDTTPKKHLDVIRPIKKRMQSIAQPALPRQKRSLVLKRQMVERAQAHKKQVKKVRKRHFLRYALFALLISALGVVGWSFQGLLPFSIHWFESSAPSSTITSTKSSAEGTPLDETPVLTSDIADHKMSADDPRVIRIPHLALEARIKRVGRSLNGEPISPSNIFDVGWFDASSKPGGDGLMLLNGHTAGQRSKGIFQTLGTLNPGDKIIIERGNGTLVNYSVQKVQVYSTVDFDMSVAMKPLAPAKKGLNLMTAPLRYDGRPDSTKKRVIVFATEDSSMSQP